MTLFERTRALDLFLTFKLPWWLYALDASSLVVTWLVYHFVINRGPTVHFFVYAYSLVLLAFAIFAIIRGIQVRMNGYLEPVLSFIVLAAVVSFSDGMSENFPETVCIFATFAALYQLGVILATCSHCIGTMY